MMQIRAALSLLDSQEFLGASLTDTAVIAASAFVTDPDVDVLLVAHVRSVSFRFSTRRRHYNRLCHHRLSHNRLRHHVRHRAETNRNKFGIV